MRCLNTSNSCSGDFSLRARLEECLEIGIDFIEQEKIYRLILGGEIAGGQRAIEAEKRVPLKTVSRAQQRKRVEGTAGEHTFHS